MNGCQIVTFASFVQKVSSILNDTNKNSDHYAHSMIFGPSPMIYSLCIILFLVTFIYPTLVFDW